ncbi:MAG: hypothetical protein OEO79_12885 [Gemmatimonadota bacterium]|nr:hypothetical protein [Gemmatimonadota bacterium]
MLGLTCGYALGVLFFRIRSILEGGIMQKALRLLRTVGAVLAGYLVVALGTTLTFEVLLGGVSS